jgi:integrase
MTTTRDWGTGSIVRHKNGKFEVRLSVTDGGVRKRIPLGYVATRQEAVRRINAERSKYIGANGRRIVRSGETVEQVAQRWLEKAMLQKRPATYANAEASVRRFIIPVLGTKLIADLNKADVTDLLNYAAIPQAGGRGLGPNSRALLRRHLGGLLRWAIDQELPGVRNLLGPSNVVSVEPRQERYLTDRELVAFLDTANISRYGPLYLTIATLGLRVSEALGLTWADLDWNRRQVHIEFRLDQARQGSAPSRTALKTDKSRRTLDLPDATYEALRGLLRRQRDEQDEANRAGIPWLNPYQLVFTGQYGSPVASATLYVDFRAQVRAAGLPPFRIHDLRHSYVALEARAGTPIEVISANLGHANSNITRAIYLHVLPVARKESAATMDAILAQGRATS